MRIGDICNQHVIHIGAAASVREAAQLMRAHHVGALIVVEQPNGERIPIGVITDRDIAISVVAPGIDPQSVTVGDVMSRTPATCNDSEDLFDAIETMRVRGVRRLAVLNAKGGLVGVLASDDINGALCSHMIELGRALTRQHVKEMQTRK